MLVLLLKTCICTCSICTNPGFFFVHFPHLQQFIAVGSGRVVRAVVLPIPVGPGSNPIRFENLIINQQNKILRKVKLLDNLSCSFLSCLGIFSCF